VGGTLEPDVRRPGEVVRTARVRNGLTLAELGHRTGYSAAQVSRYERGVTPLTDVTVLRRFAQALAIPPDEFGLAVTGPGGPGRPVTAVAGGLPWRLVPSRVAGEPGRRDEDVRRRQLLAALGAAAAGAAVPPIAPRSDDEVGELLVSQVRDAMLGLAPTPARVSAGAVRAVLDGALADFRDSRYGRLSVTLPRLISAGHLLAADGGDSGQRNALLAGIYTLTTRMLIKLDDQQLGWMAADRARVLASGGGERNILAKLPGPCRASSQASSGARSPLIMAATIWRWASAALASSSLKSARYRRVTVRPNLPRDRAYGWSSNSVASVPPAVMLPVTSAKARSAMPASGSVPVIPQDCAACQAMAVASASVAPSITMPRLRVAPSPGMSGAE
jgi:transcriptional regulator with XRE-family HTH domain